MTILDYFGTAAADLLGGTAGEDKKKKAEIYAKRKRTFFNRRKQMRSLSPVQTNASAGALMIGALENV